MIAIVSILILGLATPASAVGDTAAGQATSTTVLISATSTIPDVTTSPSTTDDTLPFTGGDSDRLAVVALLALGAGTGLVVLSRKSEGTNV